MALSDLENFIEKPDLDRATQMLIDGNFLWNAGIFLFCAKDMIEAFRAYAADTLHLVVQAVNDASPDLGFYVSLPNPGPCSMILVSILL